MQLQNPKDACVIYDFQAFQMQRFGGISRYFCEIMRRLCMPYDVAIRFTMNYYLTSWHIGRHVIPLPRFVYKHYAAKCEHTNYRLSCRMLESKQNYIFHPTYYDPYFLDHIGQSPYVITVHDMIYERYPDLLPDAEKIIAQKRETILRADRIIAISENTKRDVVEILDVDPEKIDVIYHSTSLCPHTGPDRLHLPARYILYVGDRTAYKNFRRLAIAFTQIKEKYPDLHMICTGRPFKPHELALLDELRLNNRVTLLKASDRDLAELYARAECFVYPSLYEGFGIPILEAWACRCPVVLSRASCFPEIAGEAGCYFEPLSEDAIAEAILSVLSDEQKRHSLVDAGSERLKLFSWEEAAQATENVYRNVMMQRS